MRIDPNELIISAKRLRDEAESYTGATRRGLETLSAAYYRQAVERLSPANDDDRAELTLPLPVHK